MTALGIDASNLREGGGRSHLIELLRHGGPHRGAFDRVVVWGAADTLGLLPDAPWLERCHQPLLDRGLAARVYWQQVRLARLARAVDLVLAPGGVTSPRVRPRVVMSRNMLPFEPVERRRFTGAMRLRLEALRRAQARSFVTADGVIFLTAYAERTILPQLARPPRRHVVIPHGVGDRFRMAPREPASEGPLRLLYVSAISRYKHQRELLDAVAALRRERPVELTLIGPDDGTGEAGRLAARIREVDPGGTFARYLGKVGFDEVHRRYRDCDVFVFASSCENMPNILLEAMSSGLPIACAERGPMPEVLGDAGVYFDPEAPASIAGALRRLADDPPLRARLAARAHARASAYRWDDCARATFDFLAVCSGRRVQGRRP